MTTVDRVVAILNKHSIPHAMIGAAALATYGVARSTFDVDLLATDPRVFEAALWDQITADIRRGDADDPLRGVVRLTGTDDQPVDIVVGKLSWQERAIARAHSEGMTLRVVQARDLVLLKLYAGGTQDLWDVRGLLQAKGESLREEVSVDVQSMPADMQRRWQAVTSEAI